MDRTKLTVVTILVIGALAVIGMAEFTEKAVCDSFPEKAPYYDGDTGPEVLWKDYYNDTYERLCI